MAHCKSLSELAATADESAIVTTTSAFDLAHYLQERAALVERQLALSAPQSSGLANRLIEAMNYSLMAGGKRLRPILALAA